MSKYLRFDCGDENNLSSMTHIRVTFEDTETDFEAAKAKALGHVVHELSRYGLQEALAGIGIHPSQPWVVVNGTTWKPET
jgi:hypothetical protein